MRGIVHLIAITIAASLPCSAQQTQIQATVVDPIGNAYQFLTGSASINCPGNQAPLYNGFTVPRNYPITGADGNGHFTQTLYDVNLITPTGCSYNFAITYKDGVTSFIATGVGGSGSATPITGAGPVNLSTPINAFAVLLPGSITGNLSGMTAGQVPIAASAITVTSSKPIQGTDGHILSSGTVTGTASPLCTDAGGGATTTGCPSTSGGVSGSGCQSAYFSGSNAVTGGTVELDMAGCAGSDLGLVMATCQTALPAAGGKCKGDNLSGAQTLSTAFTFSKPVTFTFCGQPISQVANILMAGTKPAIVGCDDKNTVFTKAGNIDQITVTGSDAIIRGIALAGASGSFTGKGIDSSAAGDAIMDHLTVGNESGTGIVGGKTVSYSVLSTVGANPAITGTVSVNHSSITTGGTADAGDLNASASDWYSNLIVVNPPASTSGLCGLNISGDVIGASFHNNYFITNDSHSGNLNYGGCMTPTMGSNHMYENTVFANECSPVLSGGAQVGCYLYNNSIGLMTEASENRWWGNSCTHETVCLVRIDSTNQTNYYSEFATNNGGFSGGSTHDVVVETVTPFTFATLPIAGNGSMVACSDCAAGRVVKSGSGGPNTVFFTGGRWVGLSQPTWTFVQSAQASAAAASVNITIANPPIPPDLIVVGVKCNQAASPTIAVSDGTNGSYTSAIAVQAITGSTSWGQIFYFPGASGGTAAKTISITSSGNACTNVDATAAEYSGIATVSPEDGAGASAQGNSGSLSSGSYTVTSGDLVVGFGVAPAAGLCVGAGPGFIGRSCTTAASLLEDTTATTTTETATATANSGNWAMLGVAFKVAP